MKSIIISFLLLFIVMKSYSQDLSKWFPKGGQYYNTKLIAQENEYKYLFVFYEDGDTYVDFAEKPKTPNESAKIDKKIIFKTTNLNSGDISGKMKIRDDFKDYEYKFIRHGGNLLFTFKDVFAKEWNYFVWSKY